MSDQEGGSKCVKLVQYSEVMMMEAETGGDRDGTAETEREIFKSFQGRASRQVPSLSEFPSSSGEAAAGLPGRSS